MERVRIETLIVNSVNHFFTLKLLIMDLGTGIYIGYRIWKWLSGKPDDDAGDGGNSLDDLSDALL